MHLILQVFAARSSSPLFDSSIDRSSVKFTRSLQPAVEGGIFQPMFRCRAAGEEPQEKNRSRNHQSLRTKWHKSYPAFGCPSCNQGRSAFESCRQQYRKWIRRSCNKSGRNSAPVLSARPAGDIALFKASRPSRRHGSCITKSAPIGKPPA